MASPDRLTRYSARLLIEWLNRWFAASFGLVEAVADATVASDGEHRIGICVAPLWERGQPPEWRAGLEAMEKRLDAGGPEGAFLLWVPPQASADADIAVAPIKWLRK